MPKIQEYEKPKGINTLISSDEPETPPKAEPSENQKPVQSDVSIQHHKNAALYLYCISILFAFWALNSFRQVVLFAVTLGCVYMLLNDIRKKNNT